MMVDWVAIEIEVRKLNDKIRGVRSEQVTIHASLILFVFVFSLCP